MNNENMSVYFSKNLLNQKRDAHFTSDAEGHYDMDGVSISSVGVTVSSEGKVTTKKPSLEDLQPKEYLSIRQKNLEQIEDQADQTSLDQKNQGTPAEDGVPAKDKNQIKTAKYSAKYDDYLETLTPGD